MLTRDDHLWVDLGRLLEAVSEAQLKEALGVPAKPPADAEGRPRRPRQIPDFAAAAKKLGVTEEQLVEALGIRKQRTSDTK